ncbi:hypothetical protein KC337_g8989 [Hortaea werneckii]|nr:hypothetical protein KC337_g8989 [Hortaea werneckii]
MAGKQVTPLKGVRFVEAVQTIVVEASLKTSADKERCTPPTPITSEPAASDYTQWAEWLQRMQDPEAGGVLPGIAAENYTSRPPSATQDRRHIRQQVLPASLANDFTDTTSLATPSQSVRPHAQEATIFSTSSGYHSGPNTGDRVFSSTAVPTLGGSSGTDHDFMMGLTGLSVLDFPDEIDMDLSFDSLVW